MDPTSILITAIGIIAGLLFVYAMFLEQFRLQVKELHLSFADLPPAFDGYTLLHLSDLHINKLGLLEKRLMGIVGSRAVDACVVTGDVTANPRASDVFRRVCSAIEHTDPIFMVLGNSEHKPWLDTAMLVDALSFDGLVMLVNSSARVMRGDESIRMVGVDDAYSGLADADRAFAGVGSSEFTILLSHCPSLAPDGIEMGADLVLSGHTHGGQVRLPLIGLLWTHMNSNQQLNDGLYPPDRLLCKTGRSLNGTLFVSRGVGSSRIHIRFLCPPEVVYITLHRSTSS